MEGEVYRQFYIEMGATTDLKKKKGRWGMIFKNLRVGPTRRMVTDARMQYSRAKKRNLKGRHP